MLDFIDYQSNNTTIITCDTVIDANINSNDAIEIYGKVNGRICTDGLLSIYGKVNGNIAAKDLIIRSKSFVQADCDLFFDGCIEKDCQLFGDVICRNIEIKGYIRGNINASENVILRKGGSVDGDIKCHGLIVDAGGSINGNVKLEYRY